ncbi:MAG TPA: aminotransferase class V-fold PLP-dependent enzyme [Ilumatobacteraceae bacterium]|nr:aminotransferase class V-fold PLP-dependent enzyme [Ilumatobacteraceae bacterium]HRB02214.1 aminotransferase class V-fold PLP-dependent enzyme [Ilumatobacteraceae bacterium]
MSLHGAESATGDLDERVVQWIRDRLAHSGVGAIGDRAQLGAALDGSITEGGLGLDGAWDMFRDVVSPANIGLDSERFLAFIPTSPSVAAVWMDAICGAANFSAESWLEAAGAVAAENQVIDLLVRTAGLPVGASGCFMSGGSIGNLSALAVARDQAGGRRTVVMADTAHASVNNALQILGLDALVVPTGPDCRLMGAAVRAAVDNRTDIAAIVASGGSTNAGVIDDLPGCADVAEELGAWLHVDGAYGLAAMLLPEMRQKFVGIERVDSFIVDPHKWLFAPSGSCALVYRQPRLARETHTQHGPYIDVLRTDDDAYNPSDLGYQLTRRASGLPLWFALAFHGLEAHRVAIRHGIELAASMAAALNASPHTELIMQPELGVVLFRRDGWDRADWAAWAGGLLRDQIAFVAPSTYHGEPMGRLVFMHPRTPLTIVDELMASLVG